MGTPSNFLGMEVSHDPANSCSSLSQNKYIKELASKFHLPVELHPTTPIRADVNFYLLLETAIHTQVITEMPYKELVGALIFVMVCTRPDIAFLVACLTQYFSAPRALHWEQTLRCLGYLMSIATANYGIRLGAADPDELTTFSDSDWAGNPVTCTCRSIGSYVVFWGGSILCWSSKTQCGIIFFFFGEVHSSNLNIS